MHNNKVVNLIIIGMKIKLIYIYTLLLLLLVVQKSYSQTTIVISDPKNRSPIAIPRLCSQGAGPQASEEIPQTIARDLDLSGYFDVLNPNSYIETAGKCVPPEGGDYGDWTVIHTQWLIRGVVEPSGRGMVRARLYLHDVPAQKSVFGKEYEGDIGDVRKMAHKFANEVMKYVTGEYGPFGSQIAFTSRIGRFKEIFVMDMDGANVRQLTRDNGLAQSPAWDEMGKKLLFSNFHVRIPDLFTIDVNTGRKTQITNDALLEVGGEFMPGGNEILTSINGQGKGSSLVVVGLTGGVKNKVSPAAGYIDVSPSFSPDKSQIAFCSDRTGKPQIYVMGSNGGTPQRISFVSSDYCTSPAWSPKGDRIAFVCRADGGYQLFLSNTDGSDPIQLTSGRDNEDPSWSPDGRYLTFATTSGGGGGFNVALIRVARNLEGSAFSVLSTSRGDDQNPAWGPILP